MVVIFEISRVFLCMQLGWMGVTQINSSVNKMRSVVAQFEWGFGLSFTISEHFNSHIETRKNFAYRKKAFMESLKCPEYRILSTRHSIINLYHLIFCITVNTYFFTIFSSNLTNFLCQIVAKVHIRLFIRISQPRGHSTRTGGVVRCSYVQDTR